MKYQLLKTNTIDVIFISYIFVIYQCFAYFPIIYCLIDVATNRGKQLFNYILTKHREKGEFEIHYLVFEGSFNRVKLANPTYNFYDFTASTDGISEINAIPENSVVAIDSLTHLFHFSSTQYVFRLIKNITNKQSKFALNYVIFYKIM